MSTEDNNDYLDELSVSIATLEELSEDNYQKIKTEVFSWEPSQKTKNDIRGNADNFQIVSFSVVAFYQNALIKNCQI